MANTPTAKSQSAGVNNPNTKASPNTPENIAAMGPKSSGKGSIQAPIPPRTSATNKQMKSAPAGTQMLVKRLKDSLATRGARGYIGLQRKFRIMDDDGSKTLDLREFKKGLTESGLSLAENDMRVVFQHFDQDGSGTIDFEEFIQGLRDTGCLVGRLHREEGVSHTTRTVAT